VPAGRPRRSRRRHRRRHLSVIDEECAAASRMDDDLVERWLSHRNDVSALAPLWRAGIVVDTVEVAGAGLSSSPGGLRPRRTARTSRDTRRLGAPEPRLPDGACLYFTFAGRPPDDGNDEVGRRLA